MESYKHTTKERKEHYHDEQNLDDRDQHPIRPRRRLRLCRMHHRPAARRRDLPAL